MSSKNENNTVFYGHPKDWVDWSHEFRVKARALQLWDYVDPATRKSWPVEPGAPSFTAYPKRLARIETRASSQSTPSHATIVEEADPRGIPASVVEMTAEGRAAYQLDWSAYVFQAKEYKEHVTNLEKLTSWVFLTTSKTLLKVCCKEGETMDKWYIAFQETGSAYEENRVPDARAKYKASVKPLSKLPRSFDNWLTEWETALAEGQQLEIPDTAKATFWAEDLALALKTVLPIWAANFITNNKEKIQDDTLSYREVAADLSRTWNVIQQPKATLAKGAFPSYVPVQPEKHPQIAGSDDEEQPQKKGSKKQGKGKRKRAETDKTSQNADSGGSCGACLGPHNLKDCYYVFKERAPADWRPNIGMQRLVEDRLKNNIELTELIKRIRKVKFTDVDES